MRVPFLAYPTPLRDASGAVTGAVNMLVDATEIRRNQELRERLGAIVESPDGFRARKRYRLGDPRHQCGRHEVISGS